MSMPHVLLRPWPWYIAGPLIGLFAPLLLWLDNRLFGVSSNLRHLCAAIVPRGIPYLRYDWRREGSWNLVFVAGILIGGVIAGTLLRDPDPVAISAAARSTLVNLGVHDFSGLMPRDLFSWASLGTPRGWMLIAGGGFLAGFGASYAGGCTSGHGISGLANLEVPSLIALIGFFAGGILATFLLLPLLLGMR